MAVHAGAATGAVLSGVAAPLATFVVPRSAGRAARDSYAVPDLLAGTSRGTPRAFRAHSSVDSASGTAPRIL